MLPEALSEDINRRSFIKNVGKGLVALGVASAGVATWDNSVNIPRERDELVKELTNKYPPKPAKEIQRAQGEITVFKGTTERLAREGRLEQLPGFVDEAAVQEAYKVVDQESDRQDAIQNMVEHRGFLDRAKRNLLFIGGGGIVAMVGMPMAMLAEPNTPQPAPQT